MQKFDLAKVTAEQKAKWDDHAETYAEVILTIHAITLLSKYLRHSRDMGSFHQASKEDILFFEPPLLVPLSRM